MSNAARDLRYGRRAGRWAGAEAGQVGAIVALFVDERARARDRGEPWPDPDLSSKVRLPEGPEEWQGRARLARARALAGLELNETDRAALRSYPNPPSAIFAGELLPSLDELLEPPS